MTTASQSIYHQQYNQYHQHPPSVEAYAQSLLARHASEPPDESLGAYITGVLQSKFASATSNLHHSQQQEDEDETAAMIELLTEHAHMTDARAQAVLQEIEHVVRSGVVPELEPSLREEEEAASHPYTTSATGKCALLETPEQPISIAGLGAGIGPSVLSPLHEDNLIPVDLLGCLDGEVQQRPKDNEEPPKDIVSSPVSRMSSSSVTIPTAIPNMKLNPAIEVISGSVGSATSSISQAGTAIDEAMFPPLSATSMNGKGKVSITDSEFPPLGADVSNARMGSLTSSKKALRKKSRTSASSSTSSSSSQPVAATDLAAALFKPPRRSRPNSIDETHSTSTSSNHENDPTAISAAVPYQGQASYQYSNPYNPYCNTTSPYSELQFQSTVEILLSMNANLSEFAAKEAARLAPDYDINIAQYVVDTAVAAPPVCRHLLLDGCYRSDCQFSHDIDTHTCLFWIKGRCSKGDQCRFLHGFHESLIQDIVTRSNNNDNNNYQQQQQQWQLEQQAMTYYDPAAYGEGMANNYMINSDSASGTWGEMHSFYAQQQQQQSSSFSFANVASENYDTTSSFANSTNNNDSILTASLQSIRTVKIPQDLWTPHEGRDSSAFYITDPLERYHYVTSCARCRPDVIDLHYQSTKTFPFVLSTVLHEKLELQGLKQVWIVTGTGHHVGTNTHQKGGGYLENSVLQWLVEQGYHPARGRDRNKQGGAILVEL